MGAKVELTTCRNPRVVRNCGKHVDGVCEDPAEKRAMPTMRHPLILHPDSPRGAVSQVEAYISRGNTGNLLVHYYVAGDPSLFIQGWPPHPSWKRADDLWKHTCFEAFVKPTGAEGYFEFNFAPSFAWAAYRFADYRRHRQNADILKPRPEAAYGGDFYELRAHLRLEGLPELAGDWRVGISAVIEEANGNISHWALRHPPGKADFHHADGFALELPAI